MRVATYNVNGIHARLPLLLKWLKESTPDVVCLQELKAPDLGFPREAIEEAGYGAVWHGQKSWNGVAILARGSVPKLTQRGLSGDLSDIHSRYIEATIGDLLIGCLYLPNGNPAPGPKFDYKLAWFARLISHAKTLIGGRIPAVLAGDYNAIPTEFDVYAPDRWREDALFRNETRAVFRELVEQGWVDAIRDLFPHAPTYTFWKYWRNSFARDAGLRIDHLLISPSLRRHLKSGGVDRWVRSQEKTSDHAPVWVELAIPARSAKKTRKKKSSA